MGFGFGQGQRAMMRAFAAEADIAEMQVSAAGSLRRNEGWGDHKPLFKGQLLRFGLTVVITAFFIAMLSSRLAQMDFDSTAAAISAVPWQAWCAALALTGAAFWAVGHYDAVLHRHFATGIDSAAARRAGISAIAVSQTLGLGVVTGAILRWRMLPDQSFWLASRITVAVALSFLAGWAVVTAGTVIVLGTPGYAFYGWAVLGVGALATLLALAAPPAPFRWPNLFTIFALVTLCAFDTLAAGCAFYVLLPPEVALPFAVVLPAFLLAYGAGLLSGAPGGIGAFELTLLALLPPLSAEPILAGVIGWRLAYFVLPAILGAAVAMRGPRRTGVRPVMQRRQQPPMGLRVPAEYGLLAQGEHRFLFRAGQGWMAALRGHVVVGLLDPILCSPRADSYRVAFAELGQYAQSAARWPALYKVSRRTAAAARACGWRVIACAREAVLTPAHYDLNSPTRAALRRKLRRAQQAGLVVRHVPAAKVPMAQLANVSQAWVHAHGGERGFSMGRFAPDYIARQRIFVAYKEGVVVGFASFHTTRTTPDSPVLTISELTKSELKNAELTNAEWTGPEIARPELPCPDLPCPDLPCSELPCSIVDAPLLGRPDMGFAFAGSAIGQSVHPSIEQEVCGDPNGDQWALDLMRYTTDMPDGGMHALVHAALIDAAGQGVGNVSLSAASELAFVGGVGCRAVRRLAPLLHLLRLDAGHGLRRFKDSFAPDWQTRYICAPHWPGLILAAASIARAVAAPPPLPRNASPIGHQSGAGHNRFALRAAIWQGLGQRYSAK